MRKPPRKEKNETVIGELAPGEYTVAEVVARVNAVLRERERVKAWWFEEKCGAHG